MTRTQHRHRAPRLSARIADTLFSPIPAYGTITVVFVQLAALVAHIGIAYVIINTQRSALAEIPRPAPSVQVVPGPTITAQPTVRRGEVRR